MPLPDKFQPRLYRITYEVRRPWGAWEKRRIDTYKREEADEALATLRALETSPDVEPPLRRIQTTF